MATSRLHLVPFSYRFADQVLNSRLAVKREIEQVLLDPQTETAAVSRRSFNKVLAQLFVERGWMAQPSVFEESGPGIPGAKMDFLKDRVGIEVGFGHPSFIGIDLLKFQVASYSGLDKIDLGVYIVTTQAFQRRMREIGPKGPKWEGSLNFEKVVRYLPHFKSAIQVPIYVIGIDA